MGMCWASPALHLSGPCWWHQPLHSLQECNNCFQFTIFLDRGSSSGFHLAFANIIGCSRTDENGVQGKKIKLGVAALVVLQTMRSPRRWVETEELRTDSRGGPTARGGRGARSLGRSACETQGKPEECGARKPTKGRVSRTRGDKWASAGSEKEGEDWGFPTEFSHVEAPTRNCTHPEADCWLLWVCPAPIKSGRSWGPWSCLYPDSLPTSCRTLLETTYCHHTVTSEAHVWKEGSSSSLKMWSFPSECRVLSKHFSTFQQRDFPGPGHAVAVQGACFSPQWGRLSLGKLRCRSQRTSVPSTTSSTGCARRGQWRETSWLTEDSFLPMTLQSWGRQGPREHHGDSGAVFPSWLVILGPTQRVITFNLICMAHGGKEKSAVCQRWPSQWFWWPQTPPRCPRGSIS